MNQEKCFDKIEFKNLEKFLASLPNKPDIDFNDPALGRNIHPYSEKVKAVFINKHNIKIVDVIYFPETKELKFVEDCEIKSFPKLNLNKNDFSNDIFYEPLIRELMEIEDDEDQESSN